MLMISSFSSFKISYVVIPNPKLLLCIPASAADATAANPNGVKTHLANGLSTFFIKGTPIVSNGPRSIPRRPPDCTIYAAELCIILY